MSDNLKIAVIRHGMGLSAQNVADMEGVTFSRVQISNWEQGRRKLKAEYVSQLNDICIRRNGLLSALKADLYGSDNIKLPYCESLEVYERVAGKSVEQWLLWQSVIAELLSKGAPITLDEDAKIPSSFAAVQNWLRG